MIETTDTSAETSGHGSQHEPRSGAAHRAAFSRIGHTHARSLRRFRARVILATCCAVTEVYPAGEAPSCGRRTLLQRTFVSPEGSSVFSNRSRLPAACSTWCATTMALIARAGSIGKAAKLNGGGAKSTGQFGNVVCCSAGRLRA